MTRTPLTDDERAVMEYLGSADPPATQPAPRLLTDSLRRILEAGNQVDALAQEQRRLADIALRYYIERGVVTDASPSST